MKNETITLTVSDGTEMLAYVSRPEGTPRAGILVFQEAFGVNHYMKGIADRFAAEGYLAIAPELFHRSGNGIEVDYTALGSTGQYMEKISTETLEADSRAAFDWLMAEDCNKIVAIGFCMGGRVSYIANSILPLAAAVSFYGGGIAPALLDRVPTISGPMLFFWGGLDTHIPQEQWGQIGPAFIAAGKSHLAVEMGEAKHGFFNDERDAYHEPSSQLAWPLVLNFLSQKLGA